MNVPLKSPRVDILKDESRFKLLITGRRWGKTYLAIYYLFLNKFNPYETRQYIAPTYKMAKKIGWRIAKRLIRSWGTDEIIKINEADLSMTLPNEAVLYFAGADKPDSLRGDSLSKVILDEYAMMKPQVWPEVIRPALADTQGTAMFISTPKSMNHMYDLYIQAQHDENYTIWKYPSWDFGYVSPEEIALAKAEMDERLFQQEFGAEFLAASNRIYYAFSPELHVKKKKKTTIKTKAKVPYHGKGDIVVGIDFNVNPGVAVLGIVDGNTLHIYDELVVYGTNTFEMRDKLKTMVPPNTRIFPDPTGNARKSSSKTTDHAILAEYFRVMPTRITRNVDDYNNVNGLLKNANNIVRLTVDPKCKYVINDWLKMQYKNGTREPDKSDPNLSHASDAVKYIVSYLFPIKSFTNYREEEI